MKSSTKIVLVALFATLVAIVAGSNSAQASSYSDCISGAGKFKIAPTGAVYGENDFDKLGGTEPGDWGVQHACAEMITNPTNPYNGKAILFLLTGYPTAKNGNYYFPANALINLSKTDNSFLLYGLVHGYILDATQRAGDVGLCKTASPCGKGDTADGIFSQVPDGVIRSTSQASPSLGYWSPPVTSGAAWIKVNGPKLSEYIANNPSATYRVKGSIWAVKVYNYRCWQEWYGTYWHQGNCGTSPMIILFDKSTSKKTEFGGSIVAKVNSTTIANNGIYNSTSSSVTVKYTDTVSRLDNDSSTVRVCYHGSNKWPYENKCHNFTATSNSNSKTSSGLVVGTPPGTDITICHTLNWSPRKSENGVASGSGSTMHCMRIRRGNPRDKDDCVSAMGSRYNLGSYAARSGAQMVFKKNNLSQTLEDNTSSYTYWAKPGDNIQYEYKMCGGSEYSRHYNHDEDPRGFTDDPSWVISGSKNSTTNNSYVFGLEPTSYNSSSVKYYLNKTSPSSENYACTYESGKTHSTNFYQVPAESGRSTTCKSSNPTGPSDVGSSFSQSITYRSITTRRYEVYHKCWNNEDGDCSYYTYGAEQASNNKYTLTGTVNVPYNYGLIGMSTHSLSKGVIYAGSNFITSNKIKVLTRENKQVNGATPYATRTKNTTIKIVSFTTSGNPSQNAAVVDAPSATTNQICAKAASGAGYSHCTEQTGASTTEVLNDGNRQLKGNSIKTISASYSVPTDVVPGTRVCTVVAYWPVDSHDTATSTNPNNYNSKIDDLGQSAALNSGGSHWAVSAPACVTVAKKPTFSVESSQAVTSGDVKTSMTTINGRNYGSWSEYGLIAGGSVSNMASGAALGYQKQTFSTNLRNNMNAPAALADSGAPGAKTGCYISPQTMLNNNCSNLGGATRIISNYKGNEVAKKLADMYLMSDAKIASYDDDSGMKGINSSISSVNGQSATVNIGGKSFYNFYDRGDNACRYNTATGKYYAPAWTNNSYVMDKSNRYRPPVLCTENGVKYYKISGDGWIHGAGLSSDMQVGGAGTSDLGSASGSNSSYRNVTYVFDFRGTAIIDENMIINNAGRGDEFSTLDQLPTVLIFADDVIITENVTRLDAWIILGVQHDMSELSRDVHAATGYDGSGELNTCGASSNGRSVTLISDYNSNICEKKLYINSPVYAKKLTLRRNHGAQYDPEEEGENGYIMRGEIFNMRPDIYYWTYYQAQRNSILTTVFSRELPVRY